MNHETYITKKVCTNKAKLLVYSERKHDGSGNIPHNACNLSFRSHNVAVWDIVFSINHTHSLEEGAKKWFNASAYINVHGHVQGLED